MAWVVDTSVLLDIHLADPAFSHSSAACLARQSGEGLLLCPVSDVELAPAFAGNVTLQRLFLQEVGVEWFVPWTVDDTHAVHGLWHSHVTQRRAGQAGKRPVADVLIEAFALRFQGLITRDPKYFRTVQVSTPQAVILRCRIERVPL